MASRRRSRRSVRIRILHCVLRTERVDEERDQHDGPKAEDPLRISWAPPKLILNVTVQLPTRLNHPVIQEAILAQSLVAIIADQDAEIDSEINETNTQPQMTVTACPSVNEMYSVVDKPPSAPIESRPHG
ncbi:hypothetical protein KC356_g110 [Hortaea werneckii]|nr:hypothetical protein KC356_g110 [Hortaea werneckii]